MRLFKHKHRFSRNIRGGIPASFGYTIDHGGVYHPYVIEACRCGEERRVPTSAVVLPHAIIADGERGLQPGFGSKAA